MKINIFKILLSICVFCPSLSFAQDVYNFYFQKAKGPQTVIQGSPASNAQALKDLEQEEKKSATPQPQVAAAGVTAVEAKSDPGAFKNWVFNVGYGLLTDQSPGGSGINYYGSNGAYSSYSSEARKVDTSGVAFGLGYAFNKYFGGESEIIMQLGESYGETALFDRLSGALGLKLDPFGKRFLGQKFLTVDFLAGVMTRRKVSYNEYSETEKTGLAGYGGATIGINFTDSVGLAITARMVPEAGEADMQSSATFAYRF